ncbi:MULTISPECIES: hypothetical protein [Streptomyces]|uniref:hypothetical protein n=1 Tax=Streptomyces TaxID=1883 RepID=UPI0004BD9AF8|nr:MULTISPECIES: hypothetical protein [unclassified Streptomyces]
MGKPNTRQLDRQIRESESRLRRIRNGEISALSGGEQARAFLHIGRGVRRVVRGKSTAAPDRAVDRVFADAEERVAAELAAARSARQTVINEAAAATVAKKSSGWW